MKNSSKISLRLSALPDDLALLSFSLLWRNAVYLLRIFTLIRLKYVCKTSKVSADKLAAEAPEAFQQSLFSITKIKE